MLIIQSSTNPDHKSYPRQTLFSDLENWRLTQALKEMQRRLREQVEIVEQPDTEKAHKYRQINHVSSRNVSDANMYIMRSTFANIDFTIERMFSNERGMDHTKGNRHYTSNGALLAHSLEDGLKDRERTKKLLSGDLGSEEREKLIGEISTRSERALVIGLLAIRNQVAKRFDNENAYLVTGKKADALLSRLIKKREKRFGQPVPNHLLSNGGSVE